MFDIDIQTQYKVVKTQLFIGFYLIFVILEN